MKSTTEPFRVTCRLIDGRVNSADGLFFLDAILYHGWFAKNAPGVLDGTQKEENAGYFGLPLRQLSGNRYAASCGFYKQYEINIEYWTKKPNFASHAEHLDMVSGKINVSSGAFRAYRMPNVIRTISDIEFYGYGTIEKVRELLSYIPAIGKKFAEGWGMVREWVVEPWPEDWSTESPKYGLMRPMPVEEWRDTQGLKKQVCGIRPPYWKARNQTLCYIPEVNR